MKIISTRTQKEFPLHPAGGPFPAVMARLVLHEGMETKHGPRDRLQLVLQTDRKARDYVDGIDDDRPMEVSWWGNNTLNEGSRLLDLVTKQVPKDQLLQMLAESNAAIDLVELLRGTQWLITVEHVEVNGKAYANVTSAIRAPSEQQLEIWDQDTPF